jgi:hypothetical protein
VLPAGEAYLADGLAPIGTLPQEAPGMQQEQCIVRVN